MSGERVAAILAADVAGYSRLMGADEEGTLRRLQGQADRSPRRQHDLRDGKAGRISPPVPSHPTMHRLGSGRSRGVAGGAAPRIP